MRCTSSIAPTLPRKSPVGTLRCDARAVEQGRQPLQACGVGCRLIDRVQHALVVSEHGAQGPQRVEVEARGALVASGRGCDVMVGVKTALLGKAARELRVGQRVK